MLDEMQKQFLTIKIISKQLHRKSIVHPITIILDSSVDKKLTCDMVTQMISQLSLCVGYGLRFFTAQSCRVGFANTVAAEIYSKHGTIRDFHEALYSGIQWKRESKAVYHYIDPTLCLKLTFEEFKNLQPKDFHKLAGTPVGCPYYKQYVSCTVWTPVNI
jgi:hypothetical protein